MKLERLLLFLGSLRWAAGQFNETPGELLDQTTYSVLEFEHGTVDQRYEGTLRYYCTFRGKWKKERHPNDFPKSPSWSAPIMISHSNGTEGFASIINDEFDDEFNNSETLMMVIGERMDNTSDSQHLPPINVTVEYPFLSAMVKMNPSPDWFAGFSDFRTISFDTECYFTRFVIQAYVWDSGTSSGMTYTASDGDLEPQVPVERIRADNPLPLGQFLSPDGTFIPTPAEFECVLRVGEGPVVPGAPFNDSDMRPPLYVPRPDDDWIGNPDYDQIRCTQGNDEGCEVYQGRDGTSGGSGGVGWKTPTTSPFMRMISTVVTVAGLWNWF